MKRVLAALAHKVSLRSWVLGIGVVGVLGFGVMLVQSNNILQRAVELERSGACVPAGTFLLTAQMMGMEKVGSTLIDDESILQIYANDIDVVVVRMTNIEEACILKKGFYWEDFLEDRDISL